MSESVTCRDCSMTVFMREDGSCPSCGATARVCDESDSEEHEPLSLEIPDDLWRDHLERSTKGVRIIRDASIVIFGVALLSTTPVCLVPGPLIVFIWFWLVATYFNAIQRGRELLAIDARIATFADRRRPVLYLRSFHSDGSVDGDGPPRDPFSGTWGGPLLLYILQRLRPTHEESIVRSCDRVGPVVAIGNIPEPGAYRLPARDDSWQSDVLKLMKHSRLVIFRHDETGGLLWELRNMIKTVAPENIILYFEPRDRPRIQIEELLPKPLPSDLPPSRFIFFDSEWNAKSGRRIGDVLKAKGSSFARLPTPFVPTILYGIASIFLMFVTLAAMMRQDGIGHWTVLVTALCARTAFFFLVAYAAWYAARRARQLQRSGAAWSIATVAAAILLSPVPVFGSFSPLLGPLYLECVGLSWRSKAPTSLALKQQKDRLTVTCECGKRLPVTLAQAGSTMRCTCGASVVVPTLSELKRKDGRPRLVY